MSTVKMICEKLIEVAKDKKAQYEVKSWTNQAVYEQWKIDVCEVLIKECGDIAAPSTTNIEAEVFGITAIHYAEGRVEKTKELIRRLKPDEQSQAAQ